VGRTLTEKEPFLTPVFDRFADENHRMGFIKFFDRISCAGGENSITGESITMLKEGILHERTLRKSKKTSGLFPGQLTFTPLCFNIRGVLQRTGSKPRFCCLSETEFYWHKDKDKGEALLGRIALSDIRIVEPAKELFNNPLVLEIRSDRCCVYLEASNEVDLGEWIATLQRACKRQRLTQLQLTENAAQMYEIDLDQQLETIHMIFLENLEVLRAWKESLGCGEPLPQNIATYDGHLANVDASGHDAFYSSIVRILECVEALELKHIKHFEQIQYGSKDMPISDDNYLLLGSRMRDYAAVWAASENSRGTSDVLSLTAQLEKALIGPIAPPLPPKPATVAVLHQPRNLSASDT